MVKTLIFLIGLLQHSALYENSFISLENSQHADNIPNYTNFIQVIESYNHSISCFKTNCLLNFLISTTQNYRNMVASVGVSKNCKLIVVTTKIPLFLAILISQLKLSVTSDIKPYFNLNNHTIVSAFFSWLSLQLTWIGFKRTHISTCNCKTS